MSGEQVGRRQIVLERARIGVTIQDSMRFTSRRDLARQELVHRLEAEVLREHLVGDTYTHRARIAVKIPASWWQHFKRDYLPTVARRWPVKTHTVAEWRDIAVKFDRYATYPWASLALQPEFGRPVIVETASVL